MYKRWRVYSTFLTGLFIGLLYALLIGSPPPADSLATTGLIEWRVLVLSFSGILGGIIYAIVVDGEVEMPRFVVDRGGVFKAGLFGDILLGIAGAFILELLLPASLSVIDPPDPETLEESAIVFNVIGLRGSVIAATGIIGGYGGRAIIKFSLERFFKYTGTLDEFRANAITQRQSQPQRQQPKLETETLRANEYTSALIEQIDRYVQGGLPEGDRTKLTLQLQSEPDSVRQVVFSALVELREEIAEELSNDQHQRMVGLFDALIQTSPEEHPLYYQLARTRIALTPPAYAEALAALDKAIALRGPLTISHPDVSEPWQYELHRAVANIGQAQAASTDFTMAAPAQEAILTDLETVAQVYNIETILKAADKQKIPRPVVNWIRHNPERLEEREALRAHFPAVRSAIVGSPLRPIGTVPPKTSELGHASTVGSGISGKVSSSSSVISPHGENSAATSNAQPNQAQGVVFPEIFSALGRCYDILELDPFNILGDGSAKTTQVFDFYPHEAYRESDGGKIVFVPEGVRYIPGSSGQMEVSSKAELLYTESDVQKMFAATLGAALTRAMGALLPFSMSTSYANYKTERSVEKKVYAFTKAEYVHYSLILDRQQSGALHLNETFRQAVSQLPTTATHDYLEYLTFIDDFGTHTANMVQFGGLFHHRYSIAKSTYESMVQSGGNVALEAKGAFAAKYQNERKNSQFQEFSDISEFSDFCGGTPKDKINDWFGTIQDNPVPIHLELLPLYDLLDSYTFPEDDQISKKRALLTIVTQNYLERNSEENKIPWELWPSASVGSHDGETFSDINLEPVWLAANEESYKNARVKEVRIWIKDWIEGVQIVLDGDSSSFQVHGSEEGKLHTLELDPDDYITAFSVRAPSAKKGLGRQDTYIGSIRVHTHKQRIWTVGKFDTRAIALDIPDDYQVIGFQGRSDKRIEKLGVISIPTIT